MAGPSRDLRPHVETCAPCGWRARADQGEAYGAVAPVLQMQYNHLMKTATLPAVRVEPELRAQVEQLLAAGESLSEFVEDAVRERVRVRAEQGEFVARGLRSLAVAKTTGEYVEASELVAGLRRKLETARASRAAVPRRTAAAPKRNLPAR